MFNIWVLLFMLSIVSSLISILAMIRVHKRGGLSASSREIIYPFVSGALSLFVFLDTLSFMVMESSLLEMVLVGGMTSDIVIMSGVLLVVGMAIDFAGIYLTDLWAYPPVARSKSWYLVYGLMWIVFGFCMQLIWKLVSVAGFVFWVNLILVNTIGVLSLEVVNRYGSAWVYKRWLLNPVALFFAWFVLILGCVILPTVYVVNPLSLIIW
jgi:hypothetical protein